MTHTPAPWKLVIDQPRTLDDGTHYDMAWIWTADKTAIVVSKPIRKEPEYADALLLAAAPDLLAACEALLNYHYRPETQEMDVNPRIKELHRQTLAAIAKAKGEPNA